MGRMTNRVARGFGSAGAARRRTATGTRWRQRMFAAALACAAGLAILLFVAPQEAVAQTRGVTVDTDPDTDGVQTTALTVAEDGGTDTYTVVLNAAPTGDVTITPSSGNTSVATVSGALTFTTENWQTSQTVTVIGVDDNRVNDPDRTATITHTVSGGGYNGISARSVSVTATNDDVGSVTISSDSLAVDEDGGTATYTVKLGKAPAGNVRITIRSSDTGAVRVSPSSLTFTTSNWPATQTVRVTGVQDRKVTERTETITHTVSGGGYNGVTAASVGVTIKDTTRIRLSVSPNRVPEDGGARTITVTAAVTGGATYSTAKTVTVIVGSLGSPIPDTATEGTDYETVPDFNITIDPDDKSAKGTFTLTPTSDEDSEGSEFLVVSGNTPDGDTVLSDSLFIDEVPAFSIENVTAAEGAGTMRFTVRLSPPGRQRLTVRYATSNKSPVSARAGRDYTAKSGTLTFSPGRTTQTFTVPLRDDILDENDETFTVTLRNPSTGAVLAGGKTTLSATGTITDDDTATGIALSVTPAAAIEGKAQTMTVTATVTGGATYVDDKTVAVSVGGAGTTATLDTDYVAVTPFSITLPAGTASRTATFRLTPVADAPLSDPGETIVITGTFDGGTSSTSAPTSPATNTVTIHEEPTVSFEFVDDKNPATARNVVSAKEDTGALRFMVALNAASSQRVTVRYKTSNLRPVSAKAGEDYTATSGTLAFSAGETRKTVRVPVRRDSLHEGDETFRLTLSEATNAALGSDSVAIGNIVDDDAPEDITVSVSPTAVRESAGPTTLRLTVTVKGGKSFPEDRTLTTSLVTGTAGSDDFTISLPNATLPAGKTNVSVSLTLTPTADNLAEADETLDIVVTLAGLTASATLTIRDDPPPPLVITGAGTYRAGSTPVTVAGTPPAGTSVALPAQPRNAAGGVLPNLTVRFASVPAGTPRPDASSFGFDADTLVDVAVNPVPRGGVQVCLQPSAALRRAAAAVGQPLRVLHYSGGAWTALASTVTGNQVCASGVTMLSPFAAGYVIPPPTLSIANASANEGEAATFTVSLRPTRSTPTTVDYIVTSAPGDTASAGTAATGDYTAVPTAVRLTLAANASSATITVPTREDDVDEGDDTAAAGETFTVTLRNPSTGAVIGDATATGSIIDDDAPPTGIALAVAPAAVSEAGGAQTVTATATVQGGTTYGAAQTVTLAVGRDGDTASAGTDYATVPDATFTIAAGARTGTATFTLTPMDDDQIEQHETLTVAGSLADGTVAAATLTIEDDDLSEVSVASASVLEGDAGTSALTFTVTLSAVNLQTVTVDYATADGTATAASDYTAARGTLSFAPGETEKTLSVSVIGDTVDEGEAETFVLALSNPQGAVLSGEAATGTITDDDATTLSVASASVLEGDAGTSVLTFTVTLSAASAEAVTVDYATSAVTTVAGVDYTVAIGTLSFAPGETEKTISVSVIGDTVDEADETLALRLGNAKGAVLSGGVASLSAIGTITDDDATTLSIAAASVPEGDAGTSTLTFTVTLSAASTEAATVDYATADGTAVAGADYTPARGTLRFAPGETEKTISVSVIGDTVDEVDETLALRLSNAQGAILSGGAASLSAIGTIADDDLSAVSVASASAPEGDTGTSALTFTATLSTASDEAATVDYATADGTAVAGVDYTPARGTLSFAPGETEKTIRVAIIGDVVDEDAETFSLTLSNPQGVTLSGGAATGTIEDDDDASSLSIAAASVLEGDAGTSALTFTVTLSAASAEAVTVDYATAAVSAVAGVDYAVAIGTLSFAPGETEKTITVSVTGDTVEEGDETLALRLSNPQGAVLSGGAALLSVTGTIADDDVSAAPEDVPAISIAAARVLEGDAGTSALTFTVTLSAASAEAVTVDYATAGASAVVGVDYAAAIGTLSFAPGETEKTITVSVTGDTVEEGDETLALRLSNPQGAVLSGGVAILSATGTIADDDGVSEVSVASARVLEGDAGTSDLTFTVTLGAASDRAVTVGYATVAASAVAGVDYTPAGGTLNFAPGETSKAITVAVTGDVVDEGDETLSLALLNAQGAVLSGGAATLRVTGTIEDDDASEVSIASASVLEGDAGVSALAFTVTLSAASTEAVTVDYATADGTAVAGVDYTPARGTLRFAPGETTQTLTVSVIGDVVDEDAETFALTLSDPQGVTLSGGAATGTIEDDDEAPAGIALSVDPASVSESGGAQAVTVTATVEGGTTFAAARTVAVSVAPGGDDYAAVSDFDVTIVAGATSGTAVFTLTPVDDRMSEDAVTIRVSGVADGVAVRPADIVLADDDAAPTGIALSVEPASVSESGGAQTVTVTATVQGGTTFGAAQTVTLTVGQGGDTAAAGVDYGTVPDATLIVAAGARTGTATLTVTPVDDRQVESDETLTVAGSLAGVTVVAATLRLTDDDAGHQQRLTAVNQVILPELSRAMASSTVDAVTSRLAPSGMGAAAMAGGLSDALLWNEEALETGMMSWRQVLGRSSFVYSLTGNGSGDAALAANESDGGLDIALWGSGDYRRLSGDAGAVDWSGSLFGLHVGADVRFGDGFLSGLAVSVFDGSFDYTYRGDTAIPGTYGNSMVGVHPYVGWRSPGGSSLWATLGYGQGEIDGSDDAAGHQSSDSSMQLLAAGGAMRLLSDAGLIGGRMALDLKADGSLARYAVEDNGALIAETTVDASRLRLALEGSEAFSLSPGALFTPSVAVGLRWDGGDGETGMGVELGGGFTYVASGLTTELRARALVAHQGDVQEWGIGGSLRYGPRADGHGLSVSVMPSYGATAGNMSQLWESGMTSGGVLTGSNAASRLDAEVGYGLRALEGAGLLTPYGAFGMLEDGARSYRVGSRLALATGLALSLEGERRDSVSGVPDHGIILRALGNW